MPYIITEFVTIKFIGHIGRCVDNKMHTPASAKCIFYTLIIDHRILHRSIQTFVYNQLFDHIKRIEIKCITEKIQLSLTHLWAERNAVHHSILIKSNICNGQRECCWWTVYSELHTTTQTYTHTQTNTFAGRILCCWLSYIRIDYRVYAICNVVQCTRARIKIIIVHQTISDVQYNVVSIWLYYTTNMHATYNFLLILYVLSGRTR